MTRSAFCILQLAICVLSADLCEAAQLRTVGLTGAVAPGTNGTFSNFDIGTYPAYPSMNDYGEVAFHGEIVGEFIDASNDVGVWYEDQGNLKNAFRSGDLRPDGMGTYRGFSSWSLGFNSYRQVAVVGYTSFFGWAVYERDGEDVERLFRSEYFNFPSDAQLSLVSTLRWSDAGVVAFRGRDHIDFESELWSNPSGVMQQIVGTGDELPGGQSFFSHIGYPTINSAGDLAFLAHTSTNQPGDLNSYGLWLSQEGNLTSVARTGDPAPGVEGVFSTYAAGALNNVPGLSDEGVVVFAAKLEGAEINEDNDSGLWFGTTDSLAILAREGENAPGTLARFDEFESYPSPIVSPNGQLAFIAGLRGEGVVDSNAFGLWSNSNGKLQLVVREGDLAPGADSAFVNLRSAAINDNGQVALIGRLERDGADQRAPFGIWATDRVGELRKIALEGDTIAVDTGDQNDLRTISRLVALPGRSFNDRGQIAFMASFTDGTSGVFVSNLVAIPEPSSILLACFGVVTGCLLIRRRQ